jgi:hemolysin-activating ACP:hemolysin acyltransferase
MSDVAAEHAPVAWAASLGHAMTVLAASPRRQLRLASVHHFLVPPARLDQMLFLFNSQGVATGYVAWAYLSDAVAGAMADDPERLLQLCEWNEGHRLWIMDLVAPYGGSAVLLRRLGTRLPWHDRAWWRRIDREGARGLPRSIALRAGGGQP